MARLTRAIKPVIATSLTLKGQGDTVEFDITYHNRREAELNAILNDSSKTVADAVLFIVKEWDAEYPLTVEGLKEAEGDRPGLALGVIAGYHRARAMELEKN